MNSQVMEPIIQSTPFTLHYSPIVQHWALNLLLVNFYCRAKNVFADAFMTCLHLGLICWKCTAGGGF